MRISVLFLSLMPLLISANCLDLNNSLSQGDCYVIQGNNNLAQAAYERVLIEDENNIEAQLQLAALYKSREMDEQSNAILVSLHNEQLTPEQRTTLASLKRMEDASLHQFRARAGIYLGYDSNINISPISDTAIGAPVATLFSRYKADLSYLYDLDTIGGWFLRSDANLYYQNNTSEHNYDALYGRLYAGGGYRGERYSLYIPLFYDRLNYLDRDLLQQTGIRPDLNIQLSNTFVLNINGNYSTRHYLNSFDQDRNDNILSSESGLYWLEDTNIAFVKARFENYSAKHSDPRPFTDKTLYYATIGGIYSIPSIFDLRMRYQYRYSDFAYIETPRGSGKREDHNHDFKIALERNVLTHIRLQTQYRFITNQSNYNLAEYSKNEILLGLVYNY